MPNTYVDYTATAAQTDFNFSFDYLDSNHVEVFIDGVETSAFTIELSPKRVVLTTPATGGETIRIRRSSDPTANLVNFVDGSVLTEADLDLAYLHNRYLNEEAFEGNTSSLQTADGSTNFDANFNKIINLAPPTNSLDAANKDYVDDKLALSGTSLSGFNKSTHTGDNATTTFTLSFTPQTGTASAFRVAIDGVLQTPDDAYTVDSGASTITFTSAPPTNAEIVVIATGTAADANSAEVTATGSTTARSIADRFADVINVLDYGATGDGVTDDTTAVQAAATAATAASKPLYAPAGTYRMTTGVTVTHGLIGDGPSDTIFQGVDDGTVKGSLITTTSSGTGLYAGFTLDGACSADPVTWDSSNYDSFTGHQSVFNCGGSKIVISNVVSQNSFFAPFRCADGDNVLFENCKAIRGRGNFGDGYYIQKSHNVTLINCIAEDVTRIGFVCEGDDTRICENVTFIGCHAENAHDRSSLYGGGEFNAGFWFENSTLNTCIGCSSKDTDYGFVYVGTDNVETAAGHSVAKGTFINCYAETSGYGFYGQSLTADVEAVTTYDNCSVKNSNYGFVLRRTTSTINSCSFTKDGGLTNTTVIHALEGASLFINGFYENWTNKPTSDLSTTEYAGSISTFSDGGPAKEIVVDGYRTYNDAYFTVKFVDPENRDVLDLTVKNGVIKAPILMAKSVRLDNCIVEDGKFYVASKFNLNNSTVTGECDTFLYTTDSFATVSNSRFERTDESKYLRFYNVENTTDKLKYFINNCSFVGNVETGSELINVNTDTALASTSRCADIAVNGCTFYNSGGSTTNPAIKLERIITVSDVYATSVWKSSSLTNLATRVATGSTVVDR